MERIFLKSKIHRAKVTAAELYYEGSITIDEDLLEAAGMRPYEKVTIVNNNNGERFETYIILGQRGTGVVCLNGAAARKCYPGDEIIIISYCILSNEEIEGHSPIKVFVDDKNRVKSIE